ncbi:MAG TPA: YdcF family protein [Niabella sp.]
MKPFSVLAITLCLVWSSLAYCQGNSYQGKTKILQKRIFYLLDAIETYPPAYTAVYSDTVLQALMKQKYTLLQNAMDSCTQLSGIAAKLLITPAEDAAIALQLGKLYQKNRNIRQWVSDRIRATGFYGLSDSLTDAALFRKAWEEEAAGINYIINAYLQNKGLQYPKVDAASFCISCRPYFDSVRQIIAATLENGKANSLFFQPLLRICLRILQLNDRDEAARFIPLNQVNEQPYQQSRSVQWARFPFSAILVFGEGPENDEPISVHNKERCATASALFKSGKAPFIIVSGGYVHPFQTKYCEAVQMKKYLTDSLAVPAGAIITEPHARHTTTNIRNANRIIFENRIAPDKPVLGVSDSSHIQYIAGKNFERVCRRDLKYLPFDRMKKLSDETVVFYPAARSLQINTGDPLDP